MMSGGTIKRNVGRTAGCGGRLTPSLCFHVTMAPHTQVLLSVCEVYSQLRQVCVSVSVCP